MVDPVKALGRHPFFTTLDGDVFAAVTRRAGLRVYEKNALIYVEGEFSRLFPSLRRPRSGTASHDFSRRLMRFGQDFGQYEVRRRRVGVERPAQVREALAGLLGPVLTA